MAIRFNKIKKDLNLDIKIISKYCNQIGIVCDLNPNRKISDIEYSRLVKHIQDIEQKKQKKHATNSKQPKETISDIDYKELNLYNETVKYIPKSDIKFKVMKFFSSEKEEKEESEFRKRILSKIQPDLISYFEECCNEAKQKINFGVLSSIKNIEYLEINQNNNHLNKHEKTENKNFQRPLSKDKDLKARMVDLKKRERKLKEELKRNKRKRILEKKKKEKIFSTNTRGPHKFSSSMSSSSVYDKIQTFGLGKVIYIAK